VSVARVRDGRPDEIAPPALAEELGVPAVLAQAKHENFPVALHLLPRRTRERLEAVYGFARLVDDAGDVATGDRVRLLDWLEADLERAFSGEPEHPLLRRLTPLARELPITDEPFRRLIDANRQDQKVARYRTWEELAAYCDLSANPVGELVLAILGVSTPERVRWSDSVCTGLQLAEHLQDVGEDLARGRVYLPEEDLERFGVVEADLRADLPGKRVRRLLSFEVDRARDLLADGLPLVASLHGRGRLAVAAYVGGGHAALDAVERSGYDVLRRSPRAGKAARLVATARVLRGAR
jgi:squalene synthase HpnC